MASEAVGDGSTMPKFSPLIVTVPPPLTTAFAEAVVATGAAKKRQFAPVCTSQPAQSGAAHRTVEAEPPRHCARLCTYTHHSPHCQDRAAVRLRCTRNRCRRCPSAGAAHVCRGQRGRRRWVDSAQVQPANRDSAAAAHRGIRRGRGRDGRCKEASVCTSQPAQRGAAHCTVDVGKSRRRATSGKWRPSDAHHRS